MLYAMHGPIGPPEILIVLGILVLLFGRRSARELSESFQEGLQRFQHELRVMPRIDLRGIEWLVLAIVILFLELIWVFSRA
jgi:hypothetical protein